MSKTYTNICSRSIRFQALHARVPCWRSCNDNKGMRSSRPSSLNSSIHGSHIHPDHIVCSCNQHHQIPNLFIQYRQAIMLALGITCFVATVFSGEVRTPVHMELLWHTANVNNIFNWHTIFSHYDISSDTRACWVTLHGTDHTHKPYGITSIHIHSWVV